MHVCKIDTPFFIAFCHGILLYFDFHIFFQTISTLFTRYPYPEPSRFAEVLVRCENYFTVKPPVHCLPCRCLTEEKMVAFQINEIHWEPSR